MSYVIQGVVARADIVPSELPPGIHAVLLGSGIKFFPFGTSVRETCEIPFCPMTDNGDAALPQTITALCSMLSANGAAAYIEAEYFGGEGMQSSALFEYGSMVEVPVVARGAINQALRNLGVEPADGTDEFDTVGLSKFRDTDEWLPAPDFEATKGNAVSDRAFMVEADSYDLPRLLREWTWLVPAAHTPLFVSALADWVFGAPDGSLWQLSVLDGHYHQIAANGNDYNNLIKSPGWLNDVFSADWQPIGAQHGLLPVINECLGWKLHPLIGGRLGPANLQIFDMVVYQSLMGQLHRQIARGTSQSAPRKPWFKFW